MTETLTETQEKRLCENGYFLYQGCHFKPIRQFAEKDGNFYEKTRRLRRGDELGMMEADYDGKQKHSYSYEWVMRHPRIRKRIFSSALRQ